MAAVAHTIEDGIHFVTFPSHIDPNEYDDVFAQTYALTGDLTNIRLILDLSLMDHINSGFIGIIAELFTNIEESGGKMVILVNATIDDIFGFVGFKDFVDIVLEKDKAINLVK